MGMPYHSALFGSELRADLRDHTREERISTEQNPWIGWNKKKERGLQTKR